MDQASREDTFILMWRIENFSMCPQRKGEFISSPIFVVDALEKTTWYLRLYPKGDDLSDGDHVSVYLGRPDKDEEPNEVNIEYDITLITSNMNLEYPFKNSIQTEFEKGKGQGYRNFVAIQRVSRNKNTYTPNDVFTLLCCLGRRDECSTKTIYPKNVSAFLSGNTYFMEEVCSVICNDNKSMTEVIENCVFTTRIPVERRQITWVIKDFKTQLQSAKTILVKTVSVLSKLREKSELLLSCYVSSDCDGDDNVRIDIERKDKKFKEMLMRCKGSVLNKNNLPQESKVADHLFGEVREVWSFPPIVKLSAIDDPTSQILDGEALKLQCEFLISYKGEEVTIRGSSLQTTESIDTKDLKQDLTDLLKNSNKLTDVTLISEIEEIPVHKSVICARSPVFKAMFTNETEEKRTGVVRITDVDANTLMNMKIFMYLDHLPDLSVEDTMKLYSAADKYQFQKLKEECSALLKYSLSLSNVCDIWVVADTYQDLDLIASVHNFLRVRTKEVFQSDDWNKWMKDNNQLAMKLMHNLLMHL